jgi:hypothetical protein
MPTPSTRLEVECETMLCPPYGGQRLVCRKGSFWWVNRSNNIVCGEDQEVYPYLPEAYDYSVVPLGERGIAFKEDLHGYRIQELTKISSVEKRSEGNPVFSPCGEFVCIEDRDERYLKVPVVRSLATGEMVLALTGGNSAWFSPDGKWILSRVWLDNCNSGSGTHFHFGNLEDREEYQISLNSVVNGVCWILDNERMVAFDKNDMVLQCSLARGVVEKQSKLDSQYYEELVGAHDGKLICASDSSPTAWLEPSSMEQLFDKPGTIKYAFSPNSDWAARLSHDVDSESSHILFEVFDTNRGVPMFQQLLQTFDLEDSSNWSVYGTEYPEICFSNDGHRIGYLDKASFRTWTCREVPDDGDFELKRTPDTLVVKDVKRAPLSEEIKQPLSLEALGMPNNQGFKKESVTSSLFKVGSFLMTGAKKLAQKLTESGPSSLDVSSQPGPYPPIVGHEKTAPLNPTESIEQLQIRLDKLRRLGLADLPEYSSQAEGWAKHLIELENLAVFWQKVESGDPPYELTWDEKYAFNLAKTNYLRLIETDLAAQVELFGFLELLSRGDANLRPDIGYLFAPRLRPYNKYLQRTSPTVPEPPETAKTPELSAEEVQQAIDGWILPEIRHVTGLTDAEFAIIKAKVTRNFSTVKSRLECIGPKKPELAFHRKVICSLLKEEVIDPDDPTPQEATGKLETYYQICLQPDYCKRCKKPQKSAWMKSGKICWGCWDG